MVAGAGLAFGMGSTYLNPLTDFGFKRLFASEESKDLLIAFLQAMLPELPTIEDLEYLNVERLGDEAEARFAVLDLRCRTSANDYVNVEVQRVLQAFFIDRSVFYSSYLIRDQGVRGRSWDYRLDPVYVVSILDFALPDRPAPPPGRFHHHVTLKDQDGERFYDKLQFLYIDCPASAKPSTSSPTRASGGPTSYRTSRNFRPDRPRSRRRPSKNSSPWQKSQRYRDVIASCTRRS